MYRERCDIAGRDDAANRIRVAQLLAAFLEIFAEQLSRQRRIDEPSGDEIDSNGRGLERKVGNEGRKRRSQRRRNPETDSRRRAPVPPMKSSAPPGLTLFTVWRATWIANTRCDSNV